ncbi:MAG: hypothetical protein JNK05_27880 [Myxococcales bacterium]|nr:hypothetical protein [Myxococcales bacterium]
MFEARRKKSRRSAVVVASTIVTLSFAANAQVTVAVSAGVAVPLACDGTQVARWSVNGAERSVTVSGGRIRIGDADVGAVPDETAGATVAIAPDGSPALEFVGPNGRTTVVGVDGRGRMRRWVARGRARPPAWAQPATIEPQKAAVVQLAAGLDFTCARLADGRVECFGKNDYGQLGNGTTTRSARPVFVQGITDAIDIRTYQAHTCVLRANHTVACWGYGEDGQLGQGARASSNVPVAVRGINDAVHISAGHSHSCAVRRNGSVWCWGSNNLGQLGASPAADGPRVAAALAEPSTPPQHTAVTGAGSLVPIEIAGVRDAVQAGCGYGHTCALRRDGTVWCWGLNNYGQLGDGTRTHRLTPSAVPGLSNVRTLAVSDPSCAITMNGQALCWGNNSMRQTGLIDSAATLTPSPIRLTSVIDIAIGPGSHVCARTQTFVGAYCWGDNMLGELGNGSTQQLTSPAPMRDVPSPVHVVAGQNHTCVLSRDGTVRCAGSNREGALGQERMGIGAEHSMPVIVQGL